MNNNLDKDIQVLKEIKDTIFMIDKQYRTATFEEKLDLKEARNEAFNAYILARVKLIDEGVICTAEDVNEMRRIREEVEQAANTQSLIVGSFRLVRFLTGLLNV